MDTTNFNFNYLKDYVVFLSDNKIFNELSRANLRLSREANLPLLDLFSHLSEGELLQRVAQPLQEFFAQVLDDTALAHGIENIDAWKADKLEGVPRHKIQITDIVLLYSIRKKMFLEFLEEYTTNSKVCIQVMRELEDFYLQLERHAFQAYVEIQQEALFEKNEFLSSLIENFAMQNLSLPMTL